ncbi:PaaI family thioesterase [Oceanibacterium hippocampi]|uniref:Acyl-CoA thioesterase-like N-terminal HotDog domain-containing protein n=1 Tax=Oceanibacterium hippocampi TaxID=745714 RepID=A0A1Y5TQ29_9PROT|nr:PaaI family thioesterase [Oceanibacterium hippocampi]SLN69341.1 hypothetical protein OCH7691_03180 [Oceanibacterium hippocampi]
MSKLKEWIDSMVAGAPFGRHLGMKCVTLEEGRAVFEMPFADHNVTVGEMVHGGAIAALVDATATAAFWHTEKLPENPRGSTIGFTINYLNAAMAAALVCEAEVIRRGGSIHVADVWVRDDKGEPIARATVTYKLSAGRK